MMVLEAEGLGGTENYYLMSMSFSVWEDKKAQEIDDGDSSTTVLMYLLPLNYTLQIVNFICVCNA
jgi:hypothetical protein